MKYHQNDVHFKDSNGYLVGGSYTIEDYYVTSGQDPDGKISKGKVFNMSGGTLSFEVGRSASSQTAKWFNDQIPASCNTFGHTADELNFAFIGTLKLILDFKDGNGQKTYTCSNVALAQGSSGSSNNWWFGGKACKYVNDSATGISNCVTFFGVSAKAALILAKRGGNSNDEVGICTLAVLG